MKRTNLVLSNWDKLKNFGTLQVFANTLQIGVCFFREKGRLQQGWHVSTIICLFTTFTNQSWRGFVLQFPKVFSKTWYFFLCKEPKKHTIDLALSGKNWAVSGVSSFGSCLKTKRRFVYCTLLTPFLISLIYDCCCEKNPKEVTRRMACSLFSC